MELFGLCFQNANSKDSLTFLPPNFKFGNYWTY